MSEVISSFRSLTAGSQVFALLMVFLCMILHTMSSGKSLQLLCIFPFGMLCLSAISMMCVNILFVYISGHGGMSESRLCVFRELCPVSFLVVGECPSVLFALLLLFLCGILHTMSSGTSLQLPWVRGLMIVRVELFTMSDCIVC